jgi:hypothetical protein
MPRARVRMLVRASPDYSAERAMRSGMGEKIGLGRLSAFGIARHTPEAGQGAVPGLDAKTCLKSATAQRSSPNVISRTAKGLKRDLTTGIFTGGDLDAVSLRVRRATGRRCSVGR